MIWIIVSGLFSIALILIRISEGDFDTSVICFDDRISHFVQRIRCQYIIMIQQTDILSLRIGKRLIGISSDSRIFFQMHIVEPGICCDRFCLAIRRLLLQESLLLQYLLHTVILRGICQDQFPMGIALLHNTCYHSVQICFRRSI